MAIARGKISHSLWFDFQHLAKVFVTRLSEPSAIAKFESEFAALIEIEYVTTFPLARTAIHAALSAKNFDQGSKIIMPPLTIKGILDVVLDLGLKPIFVDLDPVNACFDPVELKKAIKEKPVAAIVTYLFGLCPNVDQIINPLKKENIFIIEDISQSLNAKFKKQKLGIFGDCAVYSASAIKTLDMYGGGVFATSDAKLMKRILEIKKSYLPPSRKILRKRILKSLLRNLGTNKIIFTSITFPILKIIALFNSTAGIRFVGKRDKLRISNLPKDWFVNFSSLQAKAGLKLINEIETHDEIRTKLAKQVIDSSKLEHLNSTSDGCGVHWQNLVYVREPMKFLAHMRDMGIDTAQSSLILISQLPDYGWDFQTHNARTIYENCVYLPCYSSLTDHEVAQLIKALNSYSD